MIDNIKFEKMFEITANEFMDKHHHYWNVFFKFLYFDVFLLGFLLFNGEEIKCAAKSFNDNTKAIVVLFVVVFMILKAVIVFKEYLVLMKINKRYDDLYKMIPYERLPNIPNKLRLLQKIDKSEGIGGLMFGIMLLSALLNILILLNYI